MSWLSGIPAPLALPLFAVAFAAVAVVAHSVVRKLVDPAQLSDGHEVAGFLVGVVGVLYSVVLGFLVGTVWTAFAAAQQTTDVEAGYVADAFNFAGELPPPRGRELQRLLAQYAIYVRDSWAAANSGVKETEDPSAALLNRAVHLTLAAPSGPKASSLTFERNTIQAAVLGNLRNIGDTRRLRSIQSEARWPAGLVEALLIGAAFVIAFTFFFGVKSYLRQMAMTALLAGSIGLFFGLIIELGSPYSGAIHVSRDAWTTVIQNNHLSEFAR